MSQETPQNSQSSEFIVRQIEKEKVLVIGDIMLDRFVYGSVDRISPESPVPVLSINRENMMLGGAGNTLANLVHLGAKGLILSAIGDDDDGVKISDLAHNSGIDTGGLIACDDRPTIVKTRFLAGHQQLLRTDYERILPSGADLRQKIMDHAKSVLPQIKVMILSDYGKGLLSAELIADLIDLARAHDVKVIVDPKGHDYSIYRGAYAVTPNKKELREATGGMPVQSDEEVIAAARHLIEISGIGSVVATRSQDGMSVIHKDGKVVHIRSAADIEVFDVSGAGDTVIATIAASVAAGASLAQAASIANIAGSIVVSKVGTAPIRAQELLEELQHIDSDAQEKKRPKFERIRQAPVLTWDEAKEEVQRWRARGLKVGFTNGCFDIVHFGHVTYLNDARQKCDRLIVALNNDSSIKILKGDDRPVHDEKSRAAVIGALGSVDMVVIFGAKQVGEDTTACALLEKVQPDIYFKGGDYTVDQIPEAPTVMKYGGKVDVMPVYDGHSTTNSIKKIKA